MKCVSEARLNPNYATAVLFHVLEVLYSKSREYMFQNAVVDLYFDLRYRKNKEQQQNSLMNVCTEKARAP